MARRATPGADRRSPASPAQHSWEAIPNLLLTRKQTPEAEYPTGSGLVWTWAPAPIPLPYALLSDQPIRGDQPMRGDLEEAWSSRLRPG